jgi:hypothetical protein
MDRQMPSVRHDRIRPAADDPRTVVGRLQSWDRCAADYAEVAEAVSRLALLSEEDLLE